MSEKTVAQKAHVKPGSQVAVVNPVAGIVDSLGLPQDVAFVRRRKADLVFLFVRTRAELEELMPATASDLAPAASLWVFFRKGSRNAGFDVNRDAIWESADRLGMRPVGLVSVNEEWSAFRLRRAGK